MPIRRYCRESSQAAQHGHDDEFDRTQEAAGIRRDKAVEQREIGAGDRRIDRGENEHELFVARDVDAEDPRRDFAVVDGAKRPARRTVDQIEREPAAKHQG